MATLSFWPTVVGEITVTLTSCSLWIIATWNNWLELQGDEMDAVQSGYLKLSCFIFVFSVIIFTCLIGLTLLPFCKENCCSKLVESSSYGERSQPLLTNSAAVGGGGGGAAAADEEGANAVDFLLQLPVIEAQHPVHVMRCSSFCSALKAPQFALKIFTLPLAAMPQKMCCIDTLDYISYCVLFLNLTWYLFLLSIPVIYTYTMWTKHDSRAFGARECPNIVGVQTSERGAMSVLVSRMLALACGVGADAGASNMTASQHEMMDCIGVISSTSYIDTRRYISLAYITELALFLVCALFMQLFLLQLRLDHFIISVVIATTAFYIVIGVIYAESIQGLSIFFRVALVGLLCAAVVATARVRELNHRLAFYSLLSAHQLARQLREATNLLEIEKDGIERDLTDERQRPMWMINLDELKMYGVLGSGSFGVVVRGSWHSIPIAIKIIHKQRLYAAHQQQPGSGTAEKNERLHDEEKALLLRQRAHLYTEMSVLSRIRHPHVTLFLGAAERDNDFLLVTEFMMMGSLWSCLRTPAVLADWDRLGWRRDAGFPRTQTRSTEMPTHSDMDAAGGICTRMAWQSACGLHHLHSSKLVHGDVKSPNILVDSACCVKLADFGTARWLTRAGGAPSSSSSSNAEDDATGGSSTDSAKTFIGTPRWSAPEVIAGAEQTTHSDIYSLGICFWELVTRSIPYDDFAATDSHALMLQIAERGLRPSRATMEKLGVRPQMIHLIERCWRFDPAARPTSEAILQEISVMQRTGGIFSADDAQLPQGSFGPHAYDNAAAQSGVGARGVSASVKGGLGLGVEQRYGVDPRSAAAGAKGWQTNYDAAMQSSGDQVERKPVRFPRSAPTSRSMTPTAGSPAYRSAHAMRSVRFEGGGSDSVGTQQQQLMGADNAHSQSSSWPRITGDFSTAATPATRRRAARGRLKQERCVADDGGENELLLSGLVLRPQDLVAEALIFVGSSNSSVVRARWTPAARPDAPFARRNEVVVAAKLFFGKKEARTTRMLREARLLATLCHPHIVKLVGIFTVDTTEEMKWSSANLASIFTDGVGGQFQITKSLEQSAKMSGMVLEWMSGGDMWRVLQDEARRQASAPRSPPPRQRGRTPNWQSPAPRRHTALSLRRQLTIFRHSFEALMYVAVYDCHRHSLRERNTLTNLSLSIALFLPV